MASNDSSDWPPCEVEPPCWPLLDDLQATLINDALWPKHLCRAMMRVSLNAWVQSEAPTENLDAVVSSLLPIGGRADITGLIDWPYRGLWGNEGRAARWLPFETETFAGLILQTSLNGTRVEMFATVLSFVEIGVGGGGSNPRVQKRRRKRDAPVTTEAIGIQDRDRKSQAVASRGLPWRRWRLCRWRRVADLQLLLLATKGKAAAMLATVGEVRRRLLGPWTSCWR